MQTFNEATVLALMESARKEKRFAHSAIVQKGTNVMIDGFHRTEAVSRLLAEGLEVYLGIEEYETDDPAGLAADINKTRRTWTTEEERRTQVQFLANHVDEDGNGFTNQQIAEATGSSATTVRRDKAKTRPSPNGGASDTKPKASKGKDGKKYVPPATPEQIAKAWEMKGAGMSTQAIAQDLGFGASTVRKWFTKQRPESVQQGQPPALPAPLPEPELCAISAKDQKVLKDWNGQLADHHHKIIRREKPRNRKIQKVLPVMTAIKEQLKQTMDAASKDTREYGAGFLGMYIVVIEEQLRLDSEPGINTSLEMIKEEARYIWKYADESLRLFQFQKGCSELK